MTVEERIEKTDAVKAKILDLLRDEYPDGISYAEVSIIMDDVKFRFSNKLATFKCSDGCEGRVMADQKYSHIEIKSILDEEGNPTIFSELYIDGHKVNGVRNYKLESHMGDRAPTLTIDLNAIDISIDGAFLLTQAGVGNIESIRFAGSDHDLKMQKPLPFVVDAISKRTGIPINDLFGYIADAYGN